MPRAQLEQQQQQTRRPAERRIHPSIHPSMCTSYILVNVVYLTEPVCRTLTLQLSYLCECATRLDTAQSMLMPCRLQTVTTSSFEFGCAHSASHNV